MSSYNKWSLKAQTMATQKAHILKANTLKMKLSRRILAKALIGWSRAHKVTAAASISYARGIASWEKRSLKGMGLPRWRRFAKSSQTSSLLHEKAIASYKTKEVGTESPPPEDIREMFPRWAAYSRVRAKLRSDEARQRFFRRYSARMQHIRRKCFCAWRSSIRQKEASKSMMRRAALLGFLPQERKKTKFPDSYY